jgi:hypothetical protein
MGTRASDVPGTEYSIQTGAKFLTKFLQLQDKSRHPKPRQNFCQNFGLIAQTGADSDKTQTVTSLKSPIILPSGVIFPSEVFSYLKNHKDHILSL